jgi:WD40 repeat protein
VVAVRADFYGRCAAYPDLSALLGANHVLVGPMTRDELARAIERPAGRAGLSVEAELVEALVSDVEGQPGALPLLSTALLELWRERDGRRLRLSAYARSGGVQGAVARLAETAYVALEPEQQVAARALLLRLTDEDSGGALVRRRVALAEVDAGVARRLADRRLLTVDGDTVEVAHEALLREWPRLRGWLDEDVHGRRVHRRLSTAARAWQAGEGDLYRGAPLAAALEWAAVHDAELNAGEREFLAASRHASTRAQRRLRAVLAAVGSLLVLAVIASVLALQQRGDARHQATVAAAQALGAQALAEDDLDTALLLARQGVALHDSVQTRGSLLATLVKNPAAVGVVSTGGRLTSIALSPDGHTLALSNDEGQLRFFDLPARRFIGPPVLVAGLGGGAIDPPQFSPDGTRVAIEGEIVDVHSQNRVTLRLTSTEAQVHLRFSPDGRTVLALLGYGSGGIALQRFSARTGRPVDAGRLIGRVPGGQDAVFGTVLALAAGRRWVVTTNPAGPTVIRDPGTLRPLRRLARGAQTAVLSPDERTLLLGGADGSVRFLDLASGRLRTGAGRHDDRVVGAVFRADGRRAVTAGADDRVIVWHVARAAPADTLEGQTDNLTGVAISPDGRTLYTSALAGRVALWDLAGDRRLGRPFDIGRAPRNRSGSLPQATPVGLLYAFPHALSPDGRQLVSAAPDGTLTAIDVATLRPLYRSRALVGAGVGPLAFAPRGGPLVAGTGTGRLVLLDPRTGAVVQRIFGARGGESAIAFSADGGTMATLNISAGIQLWTLRDGRVVGRPRIYLPLYTVAALSLSPDGRRLAMATDVGIEVIDTATLARPVRVADSASVHFLVRFTPDGRAIVGGSDQGWVRMWSARTLAPVTRPLRGGAATALEASVSPDGRTLASGSADGVVRLFDLRTQQPLGAPLPAVPNHPVDPIFTPDGAYLLAVTDTGRAYRWDVREATWKRQACAIAGRTLTRAEWADALPGRPYAPACQT